MLPQPQLNRFSIRVLKNDASGFQVPAVGATVRFFKQGATVKTPITLENGTVTPVAVFHTGWLDADDRVQVDASPAAELRVVEVNQDTGTLHLENQTGDEVALGLGQRLVRTQNASGADPALVYDNPFALGTGVGQIAADADGWAEAYALEFRYDCVISGTGLTTRVYADEVGSYLFP